MTAKPSLYDRLSGMDNLRYSAELFGLGRGAGTDARIHRAADPFQIGDALALSVGGYSTRMKTRLALARSVIHQPELLLLDEPTSGLDPESAAAVLELIHSMAQAGQTVILCTHLLAEADGLAHHVVVLEKGAAVASGRPAELAAQFWPHHQVRMRAEHGPDLDRLAGQPGVLAYQRAHNSGLLSLDHERRVADLILELSGQGVRLEAVEPCRPTLEDLYFAIRARLQPSAPTLSHGPIAEPASLARAGRP